MTINILIELGHFWLLQFREIPRKNKDKGICRYRHMPLSLLNEFEI